MITVTTINIVSVLAAYIYRYAKPRIALHISFAFIFIFLALRYDYGNDYSSYLQGFLDINQASSINYFDRSWHFEAGWLYLCQTFAPVGFFGLVAFLALFHCTIYCCFIKKYVPPHYYWFAIFLYIFDPSLMLIHSSAMRQAIAISIFLFSLRYLYRKQALRYFACTAIAYLFHTSAAILVPIYIISLFNRPIGVRTAIGIFIVYLGLFFLGDLLVPYVNDFVALNFERYEIKDEKVEISSGLGILFSSSLLAAILLMERFQTRENAILFKIIIFGYLLVPLVVVHALLGRLTMYFFPLTVAIFPLVLNSFKSHQRKKLFLASVVLITLIGFFRFFDSEIWREKFGSYKTIISSPHVY